MSSRKTALFQGPNSQQQLGVFVKMTYLLPPAGEGPLVRAVTDLPLQEGPLSEGGDRKYAVACTTHDGDLWGKPWTDVVVSGHVRAPGGRPTTRMRAAVMVGEGGKSIEVFGDRWVGVRAGQLVFSEPEEFVSLELSWRRAYGGIDLHIPNQPVLEFTDIFRLFTPEEHPGAYPRNPAGTGWAVVRDVDGLRLPNFETIGDLLTPQRLCVGDRRLWSRAPIPAGFGWIRQGWFPRSAAAGLSVPEFLGPASSLPEVREGWIAAEQVVDPRPCPSFQSGASAGMRFSRLVTGVPLVLRGFHPDGVISTWVPPAPQISLGFERHELESELRLSSVELLPDTGVANLVWYARATPPCELPKRAPLRTDAAWEPLQGVRVRVDGEAVPNNPIALRETI